MDPVKIKGGMSGIRKISIVSDCYISTATYNQHNEIDCTVKELPSLAQMLIGIKQWFVPEIVKKFVLSYILGGKDAILLILIGASLVFVGNMLIFFVAPSTIQSTFNLHPYSVGLLMSLYLYFVNRYVGTWHAAEHMAIAAWENENSTEIDAIARQNRYHPKCGGRFFLPFMTINVFNIWLTSFLGINNALVANLILLILMEIIFQLDRRIGLEKISITAIASYLLQQYITTRQPGILELQTAQSALQNLVAAHTREETTFLG